MENRIKKMLALIICMAMMMSILAACGNSAPAATEAPAENGAANRAVYYLQLIEGEFEVMQGIVFDAAANEKAPWFMAYDLDWDVSNDTPIQEDTANAVMDAGRNTYAAQEYFPYSLYK